MSPDDGAPYVNVLSCRTMISGKPRLCNYCGDPLEVGQKYTSTALLEDGKFQLLAVHWGGCPAVIAAMSEGDAGVYATAGDAPSTKDQDHG